LFGIIITLLFEVYDGSPDGKVVEVIEDSPVARE
jgi:hypothetical protein